jgi:feruloyl esterase
MIFSLMFGRAHAGTVSDAAARCNALRSADFSQLQDAPMQITETKFVAPSGDTPGYCQVGGYVVPSVGFIIRLPSDSWNGKFFENGCGGFCGAAEFYLPACDHPLRKGYACIVSDDGHKSTVFDGKWAYNNLQAQIDHGYRAPHVTALAGNAIVERYYEQKPKKSYFVGCSTGGRQALMEAQRFPWDFDGIVAGSPSVSVPEHHMAMLWGNRVFTDKGGKALLGRHDLELLHKAVLAKCDLNDGVKDGLIGDPRKCDFDPAELLCTTTKNSECLTSTQIEAVRKIYGGPVTSTGESVYLSGLSKGSELHWLDDLMGSAENPRRWYEFPAEEFRYEGFQPSPGPTWESKDFDFDRDYKRMGVTDGLYAANNPDLRRFKAAGGKLLSYGGWNDVIGIPLEGVDYYDMVERTMGGRESTQEFFRLFMVPGMGHCFLGEGAFDVDWLSYLEAWVEQGRPPQKVIGSHVELEGPKPDNLEDVLKLAIRRQGGWDFPLDPTTIKFSRPIYPYPVTTKYLGHGDPVNSANYGPVE